VNKNDRLRPAVLTALRTLRWRKETLHYTPQVVAEFWNVCMRPASARGGFGLSPAEAERCARVIEHYLAVLPDALARYLEWRRLVVAYAVAGAAVHDARLVASMKVYGVPHLVTVNVEDFRRCHDISVIAPQALVSHAP